MRASLVSWKDGQGWYGEDAANPGAVFYFGSRAALEGGERYRELKARFPGAFVLGCSTGGQIRDNAVFDDEIAAVALSFADTRLRLAREDNVADDDSRGCGERLGRALAGDGLAGIFVLSDGLHVNGSELVAGIASVVGPLVPLTGGLAGDGPDFRSTLVGADSAPHDRTVAALGFYGSAIRVGHGSGGGWDEFGPRRRITRSEGNVLYELDGEPALDLYERYLGEEESKGLPSTALLFPLRVYQRDRPDHGIVRTILGIDRNARSMTFAGDMPEGWVGQLMRGNFDRLASGAASAARQARLKTGHADAGDEIALMVSCIGRRLLMGQQALDEVEAAGVELGRHTRRIGFYSYGEISPHSASGVCQLHNQTMTITTISEIAA